MLKVISCHQQNSMLINFERAEVQIANWQCFTCCKTWRVRVFGAAISKLVYLHITLMEDCHEENIKAEITWRERLLKLVSFVAIFHAQSV